ncbi:HAMP domain-containing histidine kinase [Bacillus megaterium]|nr:HAMP domain-containing histidine kinase [Priestia megaterium]
MGLGLSLCYQWIEENNGEITMQTKKGNGTTFTIVLPVTKEKGGHSYETDCSHSR